MTCLEIGILVLLSGLVAIAVAGSVIRMISIERQKRTAQNAAVVNKVLKALHEYLIEIIDKEKKEIKEKQKTDAEWLESLKQQTAL